MSELPRSMLSTKVKELLIEWILAGRLAPRSRIIVTRVAEELGTSPTPVREALRDLAALGLVEIEAYRGATVSETSAKELLDAIAVRTELEALAARLAAPVINEAELAKLESLIGEMLSAARRSDPYDQAVCNAEFHQVIVQAAGNETLERLWNYLDPAFRTFMTASAPGVDMAWLARRHEGILAALRNRDPEAAAQVMRSHLEQAAAVLESRLRTQSGVLSG